MIRISEIFHSIQGEGKLTGTPSVFLRTSGCNLRCSFCDTRYASWEPEGEFYPVAELLPQILGFQCSHLVITGGEPAIFEEIGQVCSLVQEAGMHVTIETAGTVFRDWDCDLWSISPKMSNSTPSGAISESWVRQHESRRWAPQIVTQLIQQQRTDYQLKFVVGDLQDTLEILDYLKELSELKRSNVMMMPRGITPEELSITSGWLAKWCQENNFSFCDRKHIYWYGNTRGT